MTSSTKKIPISEESKEKIKKLQTTVELHQEADEYLREKKAGKKRNRQEKENFAKQIEEFGDQFIEEIETKRVIYDEKKAELVKYVLRKSGDRHGSRDDLLALTYDEVHSIYIRVKESRKNFFRLIIDFLMSW